MKQYSLIGPSKSVLNEKTFDEAKNLLHKCKKNYFMLVGLSWLLTRLEIVNEKKQKKRFGLVHPDVHRKVATKLLFS